jgi:hypothetical protein
MSISPCNAGGDAKGDQIHHDRSKNPSPVQTPQTRTNRIGTNVFRSRDPRVYYQNTPSRGKLLFVAGSGRSGSCARPPTASQRRGFDSPSAISGACALACVAPSVGHNETLGTTFNAASFRNPELPSPPILTRKRLARQSQMYMRTVANSIRRWRRFLYFSKGWLDEGLSP